MCVSELEWTLLNEFLPVKRKIQLCQLAAGVFTYSERDFQVFSTPDVHACVIRTDLLEIVSVYGEQAACHGGSPGGSSVN